MVWSGTQPNQCSSKTATIEDIDKLEKEKEHQPHDTTGARDNIADGAGVQGEGDEADGSAHAHNTNHEDIGADVEEKHLVHELEQPVDIVEFRQHVDLAVDDRAEQHHGQVCHDLQSVR